MTSHVDLPDGNWAEILTPREITERTRRPMKQAHARFVLAQQKVAVGAQQVAVAADETPDPASLQAVAALAAVNVDELIDAGEAFEHAILVYCTSSWGGPDLDGKDVSEDSILDIPLDILTALSEACGPVVEVLFPKAKQPPTPTRNTR